MGNGSRAGGLQAGRGSAGLGGGATQPHASDHDETVAARVGREGDSQTTTRQPGSRREASARARRDIAIHFLKAQEEALASEPLPLSRREHVLRYFTALRKQLER
jgi:hypothetical protein